MKRLYTYIIMCMTMLLFASCGQQHNAESIVEDFMEQNLKTAGELSEVDFNDIDSTKYLNDSIITAMRKYTGETAKQYKQSIDYGKERIGECLIIARVNYKINDKKYTDTYYLDKELTHVVAFKSIEN